MMILSLNMYMYLPLQTRDRDYTNIGDGSDTNYNAYPIVLVVAGSLILILGAVGFLGAICGNKALGRILLFFVRYIMYVCH